MSGDGCPYHPLSSSLAFGAMRGKCTCPYFTGHAVVVVTAVDDVVPKVCDHTYYKLAFGAGRYKCPCGGVVLKK